MAGTQSSDQQNGDSTRGDWAEWLAGLRSSADPLGVRGLLERSARALDSARTPAQAAAALAEALEAERTRQRTGHEHLEALLGEWARTLRSLAPMLPDSGPGIAPPLLGPFPRRQALLQALISQSDDYQHALANHLECLTTLAEDCTTAYRDHLLEQTGDDTPIDPDVLMDAWMAVAEPRYEAWLAEPETQTRIAAVINAWSALVATLRELADDTLEAFGLPSARGLDDLAAELQRQRRRHRSEIAELRSEIRALKAQISAQSAPRDNPPQ